MASTQYSLSLRKISDHVYVPVRFEDPGCSIAHIIIYNALIGLTYIQSPEDEGIEIEKSAARTLFGDKKLHKHDADSTYR